MVTKRAHGIDISYAQQKLDPPPQNKADIDFVILKASQGDFPDPKLKIFYPSAKQFPIRGAYHYFITSKVEMNPVGSTNKSTKKNKTGYGYKEQAESFLKSVDGKDFHFYALDIELNAGSEFYDYDNKKNLIARGSNKFTKASVQDIKKWIDYVKTKKPGIPVLLYTRAGIYNNNLYPNGGGEILKDMDLWIALYPKKKVNRDKDNPLEAYTVKGVKNWRIWQYSADGNQKGYEYGVAKKVIGKDGKPKPQKSVDLNVFNGSVKDMRKWLKLAPETKSPKKPTFVPGTEEQFIAQVIGQVDKIKGAGITPEVQIRINMDELDVKKMKTLQGKLKKAGITPEVHINIQTGSGSEDLVQGPTNGKPVTTDTEPEPENSFMVKVKVKPRDGKNTRLQSFKDRNNNKLPIMEPHVPKVKRANGSQLRVSRNHTESDRDKGDGVIHAAGGGSRLFYKVTDDPANGKAAGLYIKKVDVVPV